MPDMSVAESLLFTTVKLIAFKDGSPVSTGTGFMFHFAKDGDRCVPCIVTNKHVVNGADMISARMHLGVDNKPSGEFVNCDFDISGGVPFWHPDPSIDLCAIAYIEIIQGAEKAGKELFFRNLDMDLVPAKEDWEYFDALEEVIMIGCPNGLSDEVNNFPISRRGITATSLSKDYNGKPEFMVDMACFPGSSGSPVFLYNRNGFLDRRTNSYNIGAQRLKLVGVLYAGPLITSNGSIILSSLPRVEMATMMHLGNAVKASELHVLDKMIRDAVTVAPPSVEIGEQPIR